MVFDGQTAQLILTFSQSRPVCGFHIVTHLDVYVAELADGPDTLNWPGGTWSGNRARSITDYFPPAAGYGEPFFTVRRRIQTGEYQGRQIDWGAWAAIVSKQEILAVIADTYRGNDWYSDPAQMPHLYKDFQNLLDTVRGLPDDRRYALIAEEL